MRKYLFVLIALFVTGEVCKAQDLLPCKKLSEEKTVTVKVPKKSQKAPEAEGQDEYWVSAKSCFDEYSQFMSGDDLRDVQYTAKLKFDGDKVTIDGLIDLSRFEYMSPEVTSVQGQYDATAHTLTIQTPVYDKKKNISEYTKIGTMNYYGSDVTMVLFSGNWVKQDEEYALSTTPELVFDVSEDLSTITARSGFGSYAFYSDRGTAVGFVDFYKSATFSKLTNEPKLSVEPELINFEGKNVTVGATLRKPLKLSNMSLVDSKYKIKIDGEGLELEDASNSIDAKTTDTYQVVFSPKKEGEFTGSISFEYANGATATAQIKANVAAAPDFSKIVKEGDFSFFYGDDDPFVITDTITGSPVAVSTNEGNSSSSTLNVGVNIPEGKVGIISWKGASIAMQPNGVRVLLDDNEIYNNFYAHNGYVAKDDISNKCVVKSGVHVLTFLNRIGMDWHNDGLIKENLKTYLYDFSLKLVDDAPDAAVITDNNVDFGRHYFDNLSVIDTATVNLVNVGNNDLKLISVTGTDNFSAVVDGATAKFGEYLPINVTFTGSAIGDYSGSVILHTSAGDFTVDCKASAEKIIYDYSPIVSEGKFSFNTSFEYPFIVEEKTAKSNISGLSASGVDLTAWLEATFEVPEGQEGTLSWDANNSSLEFLEVMGDLILEDGTYITIDGGNRREFAGKDVNCGSEVFNKDLLVFKPGRHNVRFSYRKVADDIVYLDRLVVSNLGLHLEAAGVNGVNAERNVVRKEFYSIDGKRLSAAQKGLNIVRYVYDDGTIKTDKKILK